MKKVLAIIVDAQNDFTTGTLGNQEAIAALPTIRKLKEYVLENKGAVIHTMDTHIADEYFNTQEGKNLPVLHTVYDTDGWYVNPILIMEDEQNLPIYYLTKSTFGYIDWQNVIEESLIDEIWICGFCTDICVSANFQILKATFPEMPIYVVNDACAGVTPELHEAALKVIASCQGKIMTFEGLKERDKNEA